jgi:hypothetical protein
LAMASPRIHAGVDGSLPGSLPPGADNGRVFTALGRVLAELSWLSCASIQA